MKLTHKLTGAVLLAAVGIAAAVPGVTKAAERDDHTGFGDIEFTKESYGSWDTTGGVVPPNSTDSTRDTTHSLRDGEFVVQGMSRLDFGSQTVTLGKVNAWAKPTTANPTAEDGTKVEGRGNWVQFKDDRITEDHKYELSAQITTPFTTTKDKKLTGATIHYTNAMLVADKDNEKLKPTVLPKDALVNETERTAVFTNTEAAKGRGRYAVYFGEKGNTAKAADKSVELEIPGDQADEITTGKYTATITWTLSDTPL
ncbi:hypothetical protein DOK67_0002320 [Enterococcus sp. DIV0212c]|uniref:WxL domain-containing protein n=1 Tax=Enterococcus sp. DIV0212c TaxID=2230867 RepID=UPI001A9AF3A2|nr:WxL domain-containing protein [Enterococcus sp. DIV0212c]MBO1355274.1 WxL domain-containing protein [Enterococcus sp. DIV0212c]